MKKVITYLVSASAAAIGWWLSQDIVMSAGLFAFSGAITNGLAIHMLFERVPLMYGSGVIAANFEGFKQALHDVMMTEFFSEENLTQWMEGKTSGEAPSVDMLPLLETVDLSPAFDSLVTVVEQSKFGGMLGMFGGVAVLESLREPFTTSLRNRLVMISETPEFQAQLKAQLTGEEQSAMLREKIAQVVETKLDTLTPERVKTIVQTLINEHLGWLVIWGGVFGAFFGVLAALI